LLRKHCSIPIKFKWLDGSGLDLRLNALGGFIGRGEVNAHSNLNHDASLLALGALDATKADNLAGAALNGAIGVNIMMDASRFKNQFGYLEAFYKAERGAIVPVLQAANGKDGKRVTVQFDNLEIYRIPKESFPTLKSSMDKPSGKILIRIGDRILFGP